jgi:1-acyl-sn-glycerol-3-phosphate acyltransferase
MRTVPGLVVAAIVLTITLPMWLPIAAVVDAVRMRWRLPAARLLLFAVAWAWLETAGVLVAAGLWLVGRRRDLDAHYRLQRWWAAILMRSMRCTTGMHVDVVGVDAFTPGPVVALCRHASLADSLVSAWVITSLAGQRPRYVLKRELQYDPCLDIVGGRLPNYFLDRNATDSGAELAALASLSSGMGADDVSVIFPEGTRAAPEKRARALAKIRDIDPDRADRLVPLQHALPPRPAGTAALLEGAPDADVVIAWHTGFEGFDTFGGILAGIARRAPVIHFEARRVDRSDVPLGSEALTEWLDAQWLRLDAEVDADLARRKETA